MLLARDFFNLGILSKDIIQVGRYNNVTVLILRSLAKPTPNILILRESGISAHKEKTHRNSSAYLSVPLCCCVAVVSHGKKYANHADTAAETYPSLSLPFFPIK